MVFESQMALYKGTQALEVVAVRVVCTVLGLFILYYAIHS